MGKITVGVTATLLAAADQDRGTLTVQHIDSGHADALVWVGRSDVAVDNGWLLAALGVSLSVDRLSGATLAWYAISEVEVDVMVGTGRQWDSRG